MNILICDDDTVVSKEIKDNIILHYKPASKIICVNGYDELLPLTEDITLQFDIAIMDICLDKDNGIDIAYLLEKRYPKIKVIFISGYDDFYEQMFVKIKPFAFVKKPINYTTLNLHIKRLEDIFNKRKEERLKIESKYITANIPYDQIVYFESQKRTIIVHTLTDRLSYYDKLDSIEVFAPEYFIRCHKSFLVNGHYARGYTIVKNTIPLITNENIKISRSHLEDVEDKLIELEGGLL